MATKKSRVRFFLDYGLCFWAEPENGQHAGGISNEDLPLSNHALRELENFLKEYDAFYSLGLPPYQGHDVEYCQRFNREMKRITELVFPELADEFMICHEQLELTEDPEILKQFRPNYSEVKQQQLRFYNIADDTYC